MRLLSAILVLTFAAVTTAAAQPPGSYLRSCRDVAMRGGSLVAVCRRIDRRWQPTRLDAVRRCVGDIGNDNGTLVCNRR